MATIKIDNVNKIYENGFHAVHDFSLDIKDKEFVVLVGPSGCGKSTTLRMVAGIESISSGSLYIDGVLCNNLKPIDRGIAMVFQSYALYPTMSIYDNLAFGLRIAGHDEDEIEKEVDRVSKILGIDSYLARKPKALSGGQQQRVALGRALIRNAKVFLMDEPLSNLDAIQRVNMRSEIRRIHNEVGATTIYVTHDQIEAMTMADRIIVMKDGYIQQIGTPKELYFTPQNLFVAGFIGDPQMNFIHGTVKNITFTSVDGIKIELKGYDEFLLKNASLLEDVVLGFRPECCDLDKLDGENRISCEMREEVNEMLGDTMNIYGYFGKTNMSIKTTPFTKYEPNAIMKFSVDYKNVILFDGKTEEIIKKYLPLNAEIHNKETKKIKVLQFGEGNFLRAFVDWIIQKMNDSGKYDGHVAVVQPLENGRVAKLKNQDGLYTLYLQGVENSKVTRTHEVIDVLDDFINPYTEYDKFLKYAESEDLEVVISNTTEAGIALDKDDINFEKSPYGYPGKLLAFLKHRYDFFDGDKNRGLGIICCELIDDNADELKKVLIELSKIKKFDKEFIEWISDSCHYSSTLVDRIVPGYPRDEIAQITDELGYVDDNIVKGEIFHLWVLHKDEFIEKVFPCDKVGLNVIYADDIAPYKQRKVKILNGCHTCMVPVSYLCGIDFVKESIENPVVGKFAKEFVFDEVIPTIDLPKDDMVKFANSVFERYLNPFVKHQLMSIALNSISKYKARVLPTVKDYLRIKGSLPKHPLFSLAALIVFYGGKRGDEVIALKDDQEYLDYYKDIFAKDLSAEELIKNVLKQTNMWGEDLNSIPNLTKMVTEYYSDIKEHGMKEALEKFEGVK